MSDIFPEFGEAPKYAVRKTGPHLANAELRRELE